MKTTYLERLIDGIKNHKLVLEQDQLKAETWTKSCYELVASLISSHLFNVLDDKEIISMGTSVSYKTLQNIFNKDYKISYPIDPRSLNTLTKISKFIGFSSWNEFVKSHEKALKKESKEISPEDQLENFVETALEDTFKCIAELNFEEPVKLSKHFTDNSSAFNRVAELVEHHKEGQNIISNPYNPSTFELMELEVESIDEKKAKVKTQEYWLLCWWNKEEEKYIKRYKNISEHTYTLKKVKNKWKINNNISMSDFLG